MEKMVNYTYSKLIFLFYLKYLRIIISTTNITLYNWREDKIKIVIKNSVFIINLARLPENKRIKLKNIIKFVFYFKIYSSRYFKLS